MLHTDTFLTAYILTVGGILGAVMGSFINCMAGRIACGESVMKGRSRCNACGHVLSAPDLVPVLSYIFLKGKCRYCGERLSPKYLMTEIITALLFVLILYRFDVSFTALRYLVLVCILLGLSLVDMEIYVIPDRFIAAGVAWWAVTIPMLGGDVILQAKSGLIGGFAIGGGMLLVALLFDKITGKESLGGGDIKLFFMTGLYLGALTGLFNLIFACVFGLASVLVMRRSRIPFGPAISAAVVCSLLVGDDIVGWYMSLL